jgi:hypothetical protein
MSNPININPINIFNNTLFGGGKSDNVFTHYVFEIILFMKNGEPIIIEESTTEKYINLFSYNDKINYNDIKFYELNINLISFDTNKYSIKNRFNSNSESYIYKDQFVYLEINKNDNNYSNCYICINNSPSRLFFTPPNY